jgi:hypothetical protein
MVVVCIDPSIVCMMVSTLFSIALLLFVLRDYCRIILRFYQNEKRIYGLSGGEAVEDFCSFYLKTVVLVRVILLPFRNKWL